MQHSSSEEEPLTESDYSRALDSAMEIKEGKVNPGEIFRAEIDGLMDRHKQFTYRTKDGTVHLDLVNKEYGLAGSTGGIDAGEVVRLEVSESSHAENTDHKDGVNTMVYSVTYPTRRYADGSRVMRGIVAYSDKLKSYATTLSQKGEEIDHQVVDIQGDKKDLLYEFLRASEPKRRIVKGILSTLMSRP